MIRVYAVGELRCPMELAAGRFVARGHDGAPIAEGVEVPETPYYRRRIAKGEITTTPPAAPAADVSETPRGRSTR